MYRHASDALSLIFGVIFMGAATYWALYLAGALSADDTKYAVPAVLVAAGVIGLANAVLANRDLTK